MMEDSDSVEQKGKVATEQKNVLESIVTVLRSLSMTA